VRCAGGEVEAAEGAISTYDGLSWGAGDGAIAMAVLMMFEGAGELAVELSRFRYILRLGDFPASEPNSCALLISSKYRMRASCVFFLPT
jgi:hypothetical protein